MDILDKYDALSSKKIGDVDTYNEIKNGLHGTQLSLFDEARANENMWIEFEIRDVEVTEGLYTCHKCGSQKVYTTGEQKRGGDEGMTFSAKCVKCNNVWGIG